MRRPSLVVASVLYYCRSFGYILPTLPPFKPPCFSSSRSYPYGTCTLTISRRYSNTPFAKDPFSLRSRHLKTCIGQAFRTVFGYKHLVPIACHLAFKSKRRSYKRAKRTYLNSDGSKNFAHSPNHGLGCWKR